MVGKFLLRFEEAADAIKRAGFAEDDHAFQQRGRHSAASDDGSQQHKVLFHRPALFFAQLFKRRFHGFVGPVRGLKHGKLLGGERNRLFEGALLGQKDLLRGKDIVAEDEAGEVAELAEALLKEDISCIEKLHRLTEYDIKTMIDHELRTRLILRELGEACDSSVRRLAHQVFRRNFDLVIELFQQGQRSGEFRSDFDPVAAAVAWCGAKNAFFLCREAMQDLSLFTGPGAARGFAEKVCRLLIGGILPATPISPTAPRARTQGAP